MATPINPHRETSGAAVPVSSWLSDMISKGQIAMILAVVEVDFIVVSCRRLKVYPVHQVREKGKLGDVTDRIGLALIIILIYPALVVGSIHQVDKDLVCGPGPVELVADRQIKLKYVIELSVIGFVVVPVVVVVVPVDVVVVVAGAFQPASIALSHQNARPFCSQLV